MTRKLTVLLVGAVLFMSTGIGAQETELFQNMLYSPAKSAYPSSYSTAATNYCAGPVINCQDAQAITYMVRSLYATTGTGMTVYVEWLLDDIRRAPESGSPYYGIRGVSGFDEGEPLPAGYWFHREPLMLVATAAAAVTRTTGTATLTTDNYWIGEVVTKAPFCRFVCYYSTAAAGTPNEGTMQAWYCKRYRPWPDAAKLDATRRREWTW